MRTVLRDSEKEKIDHRKIGATRLPGNVMRLRKTSVSLHFSHFYPSLPDQHQQTFNIQVAQRLLDPATFIFIIYSIHSLSVMIFNRSDQQVLTRSIMLRPFPVRPLNYVSNAVLPDISTTFRDINLLFNKSIIIILWKFS